jgi:CheY-like chemotaxis protein
MSLDRVLCVDDEPQLLSGLERSLRKVCPVVTALGGQTALELLRKDREFSVIISDMRMPGMDGARFLTEARLLVPDAIRVLLTGEADLDAVIAAVNSGHIQHYLRKPVEREQLSQIVQRGFLEHAQTVEMRERFRSTVRAGATLAVDLIRQAQPDVAAHAERTALLAMRLGEALGLGGLFALEVSAMLGVVGRRMPRPVAERSVLGLLGNSEEFEGTRAALIELWDDLPVSRSSITARVVSVASLVDELERGDGDDAEMARVLEARVDGRILDVLRQLGLPARRSERPAA